MAITWVVVVGLSYLLGSIVIGAWLPRLYGVDIRKVGSGNIGSTNVYRALGFWPGALVQIVDIGKGALAVWLAQRWVAHPLAGYMAATAAVVGHMYPIWERFQGGKGVNTLLGAMLVLNPLIAALSLGVFLLVLGLSRYVSLGSMVAVGSFLVWHALFGGGQMVGYVAGAIWLGLVVYAHRANLQRLLAGTEPKIGRSKR